MIQVTAITITTTLITIIFIIIIITLIISNYKNQNLFSKTIKLTCNTFIIVMMLAKLLEYFRVMNKGLNNTSLLNDLSKLSFITSKIKIEIRL